MFISNWIANLLSWLYSIWPSYGGAIILLTLIIMTALAPLTIKQTRSMLEMQRLQPEIKRLRQKYGNDRERLNQEMMALYQANNVNPLGGCLPILVQLPIFLFLFQVVRGLTRRITDIGLAIGEAGYAAERMVVEFPARTFNPDYISETSDLAIDLRASTEMNSLGLDLSQSASSALGDSIVTGIPYLLLVIGVGVTTWLQQKQIQGRQKTSEMNPQQQMIMKVLPFMLPIFSFGFPAALVVYWFVSNLFRVGQQFFITHRVYGTHDDEADIVKPTASQKRDITERTEKRQQSGSSKSGSGGGKGSDGGKGSSGGGKGSGGGAHGSRSPLSAPPPKKRKKPAAAKQKPAAKRTPEEKRERQARQTSKRVTPKKNAVPEPEPSRRRRDRKKR